MTEAPVPDAPMETVAPTPEPLPTPTPPTPQPKADAPAAKPAPPKPAPTPKPKPAEKQLDLDSLLAGLPKPRSGGKASSAPKGPSRPETATQARPDLGSGLNANALAGLTDELQRRWNPNCDVEGGRDVRVQVTFMIGQGGGVQGAVSAGGQEQSSNPVVRAAAERAIGAVYGASPFRMLPRDFYGQRVKVNFNAREACS